MSESAEPEQRDRLRRQMARALPVYALDGDQLLGLAADLSDHGLQLRSERPLPVESRWRLATRFKAPVLDLEQVEFIAEVRWCRPHANGNGFDIGMRIVEIGARASAALAYFAHQNSRS